MMVKVKRVKRNSMIVVAAVMVAALFGAGLFPTMVNAGSDEGKAVVDKENCAECHKFSGPSEKLPIAERSKIKGPELWFAGSKFKEDGLRAWLEKPTPLFGVKFGSLEVGTNDHKALSAQNAGDVAAYLMTLKDSQIKEGVIPKKKMKKRKKMKAKSLFEKTQMCFFCHQVKRGSSTIGGFSGPTLVGAKNRLNGDWVYSFLKNPHRYYPNGRMPIFGDKAKNSFSDDDLKKLSEYVVNLK